MISPAAKTRSVAWPLISRTRAHSREFSRLEVKLDQLGAVQDEDSRPCGNPVAVVREGSPAPQEEVVSVPQRKGPPQRREPTGAVCGHPGASLRRPDNGELRKVRVDRTGASSIQITQAFLAEIDTAVFPIRERRGANIPCMPRVSRPQMLRHGFRQEDAAAALSSCDRCREGGVATANDRDPGELARWRRRHG
jgi:hypothetical protein